MRCECGRDIDSSAVTMALERQVGLRCKNCQRVVTHQSLLRFASIPRARRSHPLTSSLAARAKIPNLREAQDRALHFVMENPGRTAQELAAIAGDNGSRTIGRRLPELETMGLIERGDARHCAITGRLATTWNPIGVTVDGV